MSSILKKKFKKPDELEGILTVKEYYEEFRKVSKKLKDPQQDVPFFYIPEFNFKPDPKSEETEDLQPLLWVGEFSSAWQKILKPKVKFASGHLKAMDDDEGRGDDKKLMLNFEEGNGAKPVIAKKVARFVKKTAKVIVDFNFETEDEEAKQIVEASKNVSSSTTSPYTRIIQIFKSYQSATTLKKIPILVKLNSLFVEWENYDSALKADTQKDKVEKIKVHLDSKVNALIVEINNSSKERISAFLQKANSGLRAVNPNVEELGETFQQMLLSAESLENRIHGIIKIIQQTRGVSNWFSKKLGNLSDLSKALKKQDALLSEKVIEIKAWFKVNNLERSTSSINEELLTFDVSSIKKLPSDVKKALEAYNDILNNGESIDNRAEGLQRESMRLLEEIAQLNPSKNPWVEGLKTQIWEAKDELGIELYNTDNYQKIIKIFDQFVNQRKTFDEGDDTAKGQLKDALLDVVENLGIEISEWETEHIQFSTFEIKERGKHIENIRRTITDFLKNDLKAAFDDKTDIEEMLDNAVFLSFSNSKPYNDSIRKWITDSKKLLETVETAYAKKVSNRAVFDAQKFKQSSVEDILQNCNQIQSNIDKWVLVAQRCDIVTAKTEYDADQIDVNNLMEKIKSIQENTRDIINLILSFDANKDVVKNLVKDIDELKEKLAEAQGTLSTTTDPNEKGKIVMQVAKLRSDLIQKEEQMQAASNLLLEPYKRLKEHVPGVQNSLDKKMQAKLGEIEQRDVKTEIQGILDDRINEHSLRYKNIVDTYETYQSEKPNKLATENKNASMAILQAIYTAEQAFTAEDSFREKLLEENPNYANLLPEELKDKFKDKLETYKFMRMSLDDDLQGIIDSTSKPLKDELYDTIKQIATDHQNSSNIEELFQTKVKTNKLYTNWTSLNKIQTTDDSGNLKNITTGDYETKKEELEDLIGKLSLRLETVGKEGKYHISSLEKVEDPGFQKAMKTTKEKLIEIASYVNVEAYQSQLKDYQDFVKDYQGKPKEKMYAKLVEVSQIRLEEAQKAKLTTDKIFEDYSEILDSPTTFAKETNPVKKLLLIQREIDNKLKEIVAANLTALRDIEGQFFAAFGKDFDFYRSTKGGKNNVLSSQKNDQVMLFGRDLMKRFASLEKTGATKEELRKCLEHVPVSMWPDEALETLQAWEKVTAMTKDNLQERTEQLTQESEDFANELMNEKENVLGNINDLIGLSDNATAFKEKAEGFLGQFFEGMENADKLQEVVLNLMGDKGGLVKKYNSTPERLCQILVAIKNSKEVVESLMGKEKEKEEESEKDFDDKSFVGQTKKVIDTLSGKKKQEDEDEDKDEDKEKSTLEKISSTVDSVIENMEAFMEKWMQDDADAFDKTLAVVSLLNKTGGTVADLVKDSEEAKKYIDFVGVGLDAIGNTKDLLTDKDMGKRDKVVKMLSIAGSVTGALSTKEDKDKDIVGGLLDGTKGGEVLGVITNVIKAVEMANTRLNDLIGREKLTRDQIEDRLAQTPDTIRKIHEDVLGPMKKAIEVVGDVNAVMQMFGAATDLAPGLSIASNVLGLAEMILNLAKTIEERQGHVGLHTDTILYADDDSLSFSMRQNVKNDNMKIAQQSIDAFSQVISTAGSIAEVAGPGAPVGMALKYTGTAIKIGSKVIFAVIDEAKVIHVKKLIKNAQAGDRDAKLEIFRDSAYYAKMYVIGLAQDGAGGNKQAESLAREYCLGYGVSDDTLKEESAELILRKIFQSTGEHDDRYSKIGGGIQSLIKMIKGKFNKLSGETLLTTLLDELHGDMQTLDKRLLELEDALDNVDDIVKENKLKEAKMPLRDLRSGLIKERTRLEKLDLADKATTQDLEKMSKIQKLVDMLGKHGI